MLKAAGTDTAVFSPTVLYNEGWMLRLVLSAQAEGIGCLPFSLLPGSRWFSEVQIRSPFRPRLRGDHLAETRTHVDGVVGHFQLLSGTKTGLELTPDSRQFVVIEAKMLSPLSRGTRNAPDYDQAARTIACMAATLEHARKSVGDLESVGFYVLAPAERIEQGAFKSQMNRTSIAGKVQGRMEAYRSSDSERSMKLQVWFRDVFSPLLERIELRCYPWESAIDAIAAAKPTRGAVVRQFYERCLTYAQNQQEPA